MERYGLGSNSASTDDWKRWLQENNIVINPMTRYTTKFKHTYFAVDPNGHWVTYADAQATVEALRAQVKELLEALDCVLVERPLPSGEYVHRVSCNGDRRKPAGTVGISCSCRVGQRRVKALQKKYDDLLGKCRQLVDFYDKHNGTPCEQIRHQQQVEALQQERDRLREALERVLEQWVNGRKVKDGICMEVLVAAKAALTPAGGGQREQYHPAFDEYGEHRQPTGLGDL